MRISNKNTIMAHGFDRSGRLLCIVYDSCFSSIGAIIAAVDRKNPGTSKITEISIYNEDTDELGRYRIYPNSYKKI